MPNQKKTAVPELSDLYATPVVGPIVPMDKLDLFLRGLTEKERIELEARVIRALMKRVELHKGFSHRFALVMWSDDREHYIHNPYQGSTVAVSGLEKFLAPYWEKKEPENAANAKK